MIINDDSLQIGNLFILKETPWLNIEKHLLNHIGMIVQIDERLGRYHLLFPFANQVHIFSRSDMLHRLDYQWEIV
jgi:hypothetical protein